MPWRGRPARLPVPPVDADARRAARRRRRRRPDAVELRLRGLRPRRRRGRRRRAGPRPGVRPAARRHRPRPAGRSGHRHVRGQPGRGPLRPLVVHAADAARSTTTRRCPTCPAPPARSPARPSPPPSPRSPSRPAATTRCPTLTGIRVEIDGSTITLAATDRYRLAVREFAWNPENSGLETNALVPARTLADTAKSLGALRRRAPRALRVRCRRRPHGLRGRRPAHHHAACSTASSPSTARCCPASRPRSPRSRPRALVDAVKRVALVAERNTPVRLTFSGGEVELRAGAGDEAAGHRGRRVRGRRRRRSRSRSTRSTSSTASSRRRRRRRPRLSFTTSTRPAVLTGGRASGAPAYRYLLMPVRLSG